MGLGCVGLPESGCSMSGVPLDPPKDYGDIPPPGIRCSPENARASSLIGPGGTILVGTPEAPPLMLPTASEQPHPGEGNAAGIENFHLVVHDIGGPIGFDVIRRVPDRIKSLTVLNTLVDT